MNIPYDRVMALNQTGIYESHYLKANSPDGQHAMWIKHTLFRPDGGDHVAELWFIWLTRGSPPRVFRSDVPWKDLRFGPGPQVEAGSVRLEPHLARGTLGAATWDLSLSGGLGPLQHFRSEALYDGGFPKKKILTPVPNLCFEGHVVLDGNRTDVRQWTGLRGHNWGTEHAWSYAYGNCGIWDDGVQGRTVDGFSARLRLGPWVTPALSTLLFLGPEGSRSMNKFRHWPGHGRFDETSWTVGYRGVELSMKCYLSDLVGLRYRFPDGRVGYCYNTKFARVRLRLGSAGMSSNMGELETFFPSPLPEIALHPAADWSPSRGVYDSATWSSRPR